MTEIVEIKHILRRMRGGSQGFLVEGADGECYVAKFQRNPQGTRTLVNEWITWRILERLDISTPEMRLLRLTEWTRDLSEDLYFSLGHGRIQIEPGLHLGSRCPVDPRKKAIFDFLPQRLLIRVVNRTDFLKMFVIDCALGQADSRQAIFVRDRKESFRAYLIDHGMMFGGREWVIRDLHQVAVYFDLAAYWATNMADLYADTIRLVKDSIGEEDLYSAIAELPTDWFAAEDYRALDSLFKQIQRRRLNLEQILSEHWNELRLSIDFERNAGLSELPQLTPSVW